MADTTDATVSGLIRGALDDARELFREELALARAELRAEMGKITSSAVRIGIAGVALWFAAMFLLVTLALGVTALLDWPAWAGFGALALLLGMVGAVLLMLGRRAIREVRPLPRTVQTVKENFK